MTISITARVQHCLLVGGWNNKMYTGYTPCLIFAPLKLSSTLNSWNTLSLLWSGGPQGHERIHTWCFLFHFDLGDLGWFRKRQQHVCFIMVNWKFYWMFTLSVRLLFGNFNWPDWRKQFQSVPHHRRGENDFPVWDRLVRGSQVRALTLLLTGGFSGTLLYCCGLQWWDGEVWLLSSEEGFTLFDVANRLHHWNVVNYFTGGDG